MKNAGGFSFKPQSSGEPDDDDDVDAIEVSGDPVSRSEAKNMGLVNMDSAREPKSTSSSFAKRNKLPGDLPKELAAKLESAWSHLKRNEVEEALTLAQEVVWERPTLMQAKLIIARCFVNRKEYDKALAILKAIPEADADAEVHYYIGLSQSRLGRIREAMDALKRSRANATDTMLKKRANDLLLHLQGEQTVCPVCGKKTLYDSMVEVGNQTVCANCAKNGVEEEDDEDEEAVVGAGAKRRKRLKPPLSKSEIMMRFLFVLFIIALLAFGVYFMRLVVPETYMTIREVMPQMIKVYFPPVIVSPDSGPSPIDRTPETPAPARPPVPTLEFDSPPLDNAIVGVEILHRVYLDGLDNGDYGVVISPNPDGKYSLAAGTGEFKWTPSQADAGKTFTITFSAVFKQVRALDQVNEVKVVSGPKFSRAAAYGEAVPGRICHFLCEDLAGNGRNDLIVATGEFWNGEIAAFSRMDKGELLDISRVSFPGRPADMGVIMAGDEKWLAVADYWSSRLRHYALRSQNLAEMSVDIDLPGRPILAGFDRDASTSALLCRTSSGNRVFSYRQENQLSSVKIGEWALPPDFVWRRIIFLPGDRAKAIEPVPVLFGGAAANAIMILEKNSGEPTPIRVPFKGILQDAIYGPDRRFYCLIEDNGDLKLASFELLRDGKLKDPIEVPVGSGRYAVRLQAAKLVNGGQGFNIVMLSSTQVGVAYVSGTGELGAPAYWELPHPTGLEPVFAPMPKTDSLPANLVYMTAGDGLWFIDSATEGE